RLPNLEKSVSAELRTPSESALVYLQSKRSTRRMQLRWLQRRTREIDGEGLCDDLDISWRVLEALTPFSKNVFDSIRIYLGGEAVELRANFAQRCIERPLGNVVRLQMEDRRGGIALRNSRPDPREGSPQVCRNEGGASELTASGQKIAPAEFKSKT